METPSRLKYVLLMVCLPKISLGTHANQFMRLLLGLMAMITYASYILQYKRGLSISDCRRPTYQLKRLSGDSRYKELTQLIPNPEITLDSLMAR